MNWCNRTEALKKEYQMEENTKNGKSRICYVAPRVDVYAAESCRLLANSNTLSGGHDDGDDNGEINGAKEFTFSDPWNSLDGDPFENK